MDQEQWRPIPGYEGLYSVSSEGRVRSEDRYVRHNRGGLALKSGKIRAFHADKDGYRKVLLSREGKHLCVSIHKLVLLAFVGPRPEGAMACHNNGVRDDNRPDNLRWDTIEGNFSDKLKHATHARGERNGLSRLSDRQRRAIASDPRRPRFVAADYGISPTHVWRIRQSPLWRRA